MGHISRLTKYALKHRGHFVGFMSTALVATIFNLYTPLVLVEIVDLATAGAAYSTLLLFALFYLGITGLYGLSDFIQRYVSALMAQHVIYDLRTELYESLMMKDLAFYDDNETGQILARVTTDVTTMRQFLLWGYRVIFIGVLNFIGTYYVMWLINQQLTIYMLAVIPGIVIFIYVFAKKVRPVYFESRRKYGSLSAVLQENVVGMKVVQSYVSGDRESKRVERENRDYLDLIVEANRLSAFYSPLITAVLGIALGAIIYIGGWDFVLGNLSYGEFVGFVSLISMLHLPARFLSWGVGMYQRASAAAERTFYVLDVQDEVRSPENPVQFDQIEGRVTFDRVDFSYRGENWILKDVSFTVEPGQVVALLGSTGSGKTSIVNLIPRFYDVENERTITYQGRTHRLDSRGKIRLNGNEYQERHGTIWIDDELLEVKDPGTAYIDNIDVRQYRIPELRSSIGMVHQDPFLFSASIRENIAFARPDASEEEIVSAAKAAMIHDFIESLDEGYDTEVGERGVTLSGGQKQRVAIARAILADPRILILDDSTSSVDAKTEMQIQQALENLMVGRTTFIITHRLSTIRNADMIIIMDRGRIIEMGTHDELVKLGRIYADLFATLTKMEEIADETLEYGGLVHG
ncbi:MAG: ABC transporter ATP-binding protein [Candidatus Thorarchaeota archaeon]|nr:MAG: ABC transporter ATP-binding protein [Candidatus Thorarchaeota archaeon]